MNNAILELFIGSSLYSDRTTRDGTFQGKREYPTNFNKIISPNKKAIAILQQNGNFVIRLGDFNAAGEPKRPNGTFETDPLLYGNYTREIWSLFKLTGLNIPNIGIANAPFEVIFDATLGFAIRSLGAGLVYKFDIKTRPGQFSMFIQGKRLYLTDDGELKIDDGVNTVWSILSLPAGFIEAPVITSTPQYQNQTTESPKENKGTGGQNGSSGQQQSQQAQQAQQAAAAAQAAAMQPSLFSSPLILIAAAAAAFFFLRK